MLESRPPPHVLMIYAKDAGGYADFFAASGFTFSGAHTAAEGLEQAARLLPDIIVLDFGLDGETVSALRGNVATSAIPIIALTDICSLRRSGN